MVDTVRLKINLDGSAAQRSLDALNRAEVFDKLSASAREVSKGFFDAQRKLKPLQDALSQQLPGTSAFRVLTGELKAAERGADAARAKLEQLKNRIRAVREESGIGAGVTNTAASAALRQQSAVTGARAALGIRGDDETEAEIKRITGAYETLRASGVASSKELARAADALNARLRAIKPAEVDPVASARQTLNLKPQAEVRAEIDRIRAAYDTLRTSGALTSRELTQATARYRSEVRSLANQLTETGTQASGFGLLLGGALTVGALQASRAVATASDEYGLFSARIASVSSSTEEYRQRQAQLIAVAQENGQSLGDTVRLYARTANAIRDLTGDTADAVRFADLSAKAFRISGASQAEAAGASQQLSQALQSGVLRGDEFNSVNEQGGRLIQALADGLGVARGSLRAMAEAGQLTSDKVLPALISQFERINDEASKLPATFDQVGQRAANAFALAAGQAVVLQAGLNAVKAAADAASSSPAVGSTLLDVAAVGGTLLALGKLVTVVRAAALAAAAGGTAFAGLGALLGGPVTIAIAGTGAVLALLLNLLGTKTVTEVAKADDALQRLQKRFDDLQQTPGQAAAARTPLTGDQQQEFAAAGLRIAELNREIEHLLAIQQRFGSDSALESRLIVIRGEAAKLTQQITAVGKAVNDSLQAPANTALQDFLKAFATPQEKTNEQLAKYRELVKATGGTEDPATVAKIIAAGQRGVSTATKEANKELKEQTDRLRDLAQQAQALSRSQLAQATSLAQAALTPAEQFRQQVAELNTLVRDGALDRAAQRVGLSVETLQNRILLGFSDALAKGGSEAATRANELYAQVQTASAAPRATADTVFAAASVQNQPFGATANRIDPRQAVSDQVGLATGQENDAYKLQLEQLEAAHEEAMGLDAGYYEAVEAARQAHNDRLNDIDAARAAAGDVIRQNEAQAVIDGLGTVADAARVFGKKGFAAYKAAAIAQTLISTYSSAQKSYDSLSSIPVVGPALGGAAAAAAIVSGLGQVARIRAQQPQGFATGGLVTGPGTGSSDSIPARLSNQEYVLRAPVVRRIGVGLLDDINEGRASIGRFAQGGAVSRVFGGSGRGVSTASPVINFQLTNNGQPVSINDVRARQNSDGSFDIEAAIVALGDRLTDPGSSLRRQFSGATGSKTVGRL